MKTMQNIAGVALFAVLVAVTVVLGTGYLKPRLVSSTSMTPTIHKHDLVLVHSQGSYHAGEIVTFMAAEGKRTTHRLVGQRPDGTWRTRGDAVSTEDSWQTPSRNIEGKVVFVSGVPRWLADYWLQLLVALILVAFIARTFFSIVREEGKPARRRVSNA